MFLKLYLISLPVFVLIDMVWLGILAKNFYREQIGFLMKNNFNLWAALAFYLLFLAGLVFFVVNPAVEKKSWEFALLAGAFFGLVSYATYDLTNLATVKNWPILVTAVDLVWGAVLGGLVSLVTYLVFHKI